MRKSNLKCSGIFGSIKFRVKQYALAHLRDAINSDGHVTDIGQLVILPSSFTGGPRYMNERTQDAMTYVHNYGRLDHFHLQYLMDRDRQRTSSRTKVS